MSSGRGWDLLLEEWKESDNFSSTMSFGPPLLRVAELEILIRLKILLLTFYIFGFVSDYFLFPLTVIKL